MVMKFKFLILLLPVVCISAEVPPLNDSVRWVKDGVTTDCNGCSSNIASFIFDQPAASYAWPWGTYTQITSRQVYGDSVGHFVRMIDYNNWSAGFHVESFQQTLGTSIGFNAEMSPTSIGRTIGVNLQAKNKNGVNSSQAINIQSDPGVKWETGINFDTVQTTTGIALNGQRICFDPEKQVCLSYDKKSGKLLLKRDRKILKRW